MDQSSEDCGQAPDARRAGSGAWSEARLTRRAACALGAGLSLGAFSGVAMGLTPAVTASAGAGIRYVVTDRRYPESLQFAAALAERGAGRLEVTDGLTRLWRAALVPLWQGKSGAVAGLTRTETWAGLAEQARSAGRRSILVGHHVIFEEDGATAHSLTLTQPTPGIVPALERCGDAWPQGLADFAAHYRTGGRRTARACHRAEIHAGAPVSRVLTSWIIA